MWGVEESWFYYIGGIPDVVGRKIAREVRQPVKPQWEMFEHECYWGQPKKQSSTHSMPPPRLVCSHGFVAKG